MKKSLFAAFALIAASFSFYSSAMASAEPKVDSACSNCPPNNQRKVEVQRHEKLGGKAVGEVKTMTIEQLVDNGPAKEGGQVLVWSAGEMIVSAAAPEMVMVADYTNFPDCQNGVGGTNQRPISLTAFNPKMRTFSGDALKTAATGIVGTNTCVAKEFVAG